MISKADFIATVVNFDTDALTNGVIRTVEDVFRAAGDLTADAVTRASKACGPLFMVRPPHLLAVSLADISPQVGLDMSCSSALFSSSFTREVLTRGLDNGLGLRTNGLNLEFKTPVSVFDYVASLPSVVLSTLYADDYVVLIDWAGFFQSQLNLAIRSSLRYRILFVFLFCGCVSQLLMFTTVGEFPNQFQPHCHYGAAP